LVKYLTGRSKDIVMLKMLKMKEVRQLEKKVLLYLRKSAKHEKFVEIDGKVVMNSQMPPYGTEAYLRFIKLIPKIQEGKKFPFSCNISVTNRCRFNCWHCSNWGRKECEDFPLDKLLETIHKMQDMGNCFIGITGGEPTLRDDLEELVEGIGSKSHTILFTNGDKLTLKRAKELKERGLFGASISLDHFKPEIHNKLRGNKDAFKKAIKAIKACNKAGLYTIAGAVPTREMINSGEVPTFYKFLADLGVHEVRILAPIPTGKLAGNREARWCGKDEEKMMWEYHKKFNKDKSYPKISEYSYLESEEMLGCMAGTYHMFVENDGTVTPCDMIPLSFGNVFEEDFETAYNRMANRFQTPRHECFVRAAHGLFKKGFDEEGQFPLSQDQAMEITRRIKNKRMGAFFRVIGMPPGKWDDDEVKKTPKARKEKLDLRGLQCPEPIWQTQEKIFEMESGTIEILVNDEEVKENVEKTALDEGWKVKITKKGKGEYLLVIKNT